MLHNDGFLAATFTSTAVYISSSVSFSFSSSVEAKSLYRFFTCWMYTFCTATLTAIVLMARFTCVQSSSMILLASCMLMFVESVLMSVLILFYFILVSILFYCFIFSWFVWLFYSEEFLSLMISLCFISSPSFSFVWLPLTVGG